MEKIAQFKQLWDGTSRIMHVSRLKYGKSDTELDHKAVCQFYKKQVIEDLWYSKTFVNEYNQGLLEIAPDKQTRMKMKQVFLQFSPARKSQTITWICMAVSLLMLLIGSLFLPNSHQSLAHVIVVLGIVAIMATVCLFTFRYNRTTWQAVAEELTRIGNIIENNILTNK